MNSAASENEKNKTSAPETDSGERLQKLMAKAGLGSRRACETLIEAGRVSINGHIITELGTRADLSSDRVVVDGKPLTLPSGPAVVVMLHKPRGVMTTRNDPENRATVMELLPRKWENLHPVGRLDFDTSGLLLLTDDGELTQLLTHPSHGVDKTYQARVRGQVKGETVRLLQDGVRLEDGVSGPCRVRVRAQTQNNALVEITLREGRNRQVRRMLEAVGHQVSSLRRIKFGPIEIEGVALGAYRQLLPGEVHMLRKAATSKTKMAKAKNQAPRARKLSPASPISADERARRKNVVRMAKAVKSNARAAAYRASKQNADSSNETSPNEIIAPARSTTRRDANPISRGPSTRPISGRPTSSRPTSSRPTSSRPMSSRPTSSSTSTVRSRTAQPRDERGRTAQPRDDRSRNAQPRNAQPRNDRSRTAQPRDERGRNAQPRDERGRNLQPRDERSRTAQPRDERATAPNNRPYRPPAGKNLRGKKPASSAPEARGENTRFEGEKSAVAKRIQKRWQ